MLVEGARAHVHIGLDQVGPGFFVGHGVVEAHAVLKGEEGEGAFARGVRQESPVETAPSQGAPVECTYVTSDLTADSVDTSIHTSDLGIHLLLHLSHVVLGGGVSELLLDPADTLHH